VGNVGIPVAKFPFRYMVNDRAVEVCMFCAERHIVFPSLNASPGHNVWSVEEGILSI